MASVSVGSDIFAVVSLLAISVLVLLLLRYYLPLRSTPAYLLVPVFLALVLPCSIILLVPIDLASSTEATDDGPVRGVWLPEGVVLVCWRIAYWTTFFLTWLMLPLLGEYVDSGYREFQGRMLDSFRINARYQAIGLGLGIAGLIYFIWENGFHFASIKGLVMALAYAWGLVLAIGLMGHGLVALPRRLFKNASVSGRLRRLQAQAPKTKEKLDDAADELEDLEHTVWQLKQRKSGTSQELQDWIDELVDMTAMGDSRPGMAARISAANVQIPAVVTERYLADLTRKLRRAKHKHARFAADWSRLCQQAQDAQAILDAATSKKLDFGRETPSSKGWFSRLRFLTPTMRFYLHMHIIPATRIAASVFLAVASLMVVYSEIVASFAPRASVIGLTVVHRLNSEGSKVGFAGQIIASAWLLYMDTCTLYAISDVKVWGDRALVKRQTFAESACWYSLQVAKLTVPLSYNFITMLPPSVFQETAFYKFLGKLINLTPLGYGFSTFFPCFLLLPVLASLFNIYGRMKTIIGFGVLEDESDDNPTGFGTGGWREGRALIEREIQPRGEASNLGLATRTSTSLDLHRPRNDTSTPPLTRGRAPQRDPLLPTSSNAPAPDPDRIRGANRQFRDLTGQGQGEPDPNEDDGPRFFYQDFAERVRNTFETAERPEWVRNLGSALKTPRWMTQQDQAEGGGSGGGEGRGGLSRWFGGRSEGGRVRL